MQASLLVEQLQSLGCDFFCGVPDSQLRAFCDCIISKYGISEKHIIATNEGSCTAIATGHFLATGRVPVVYMQNSGIGNAVNPIASLLNRRVYGIPCVFIVGWRGEPGLHDEPQHVFQGMVTIKLLDDMEISTFVLDTDTTKEDLQNKINEFRPLLSDGKSVAFIIKKNALSNEEKIKYKNSNELSREKIINHITAVSGDDAIISTTGKSSRELFEARENNLQPHKCDFLTVGSMGHSLSIALGVALNKPKTQVWCIDGDAAALMHMGTMALVGSNKPKNMIHCVINNASHESVGGMPTVSDDIDFVKIAKGCGYPNAVCVNNAKDLDKALKDAKKRQALSFIEIKASISSRADLGRPTTTAIENKEKFMEFLSQQK